MNQSIPKRTVGAATTWYSGGTPNRARKDYWNGDIPWITAFTLKESEISTSNQFLTAQGVEAGSKMAPIGSTLLLVRGSALHNEIRAGIVVAPVAFNQDVKALAPKRGLVPKYLTHVLRGNESELLKLVTSAGNTAGVLDTKVVQSFEIYFPSESEQQVLVAAFDDLDRLVTSMERLIAKKQAIKQGMMQYLLSGRTRLPGFSEEWMDTQLGDVAHMGSGGTPDSKTATYYGGGIPWVSIADMTSTGKYIGRTEKTLTAEGIQASAARLYEPDAVLYAMYASIGECSIAVGAVSSSQAILGIVPGPKLHREFLYYYLSSIKLRVKGMGQHGTQSNLNAGMVRAFQLRLPEIQEQTEIASVLMDVDSELDVLNLKLDQTRSIKQGMIQELLSGRTRLPVAETAS